MERPVSFDVTDYHPDGEWWSNDVVLNNEPMTGPSSPIRQIPEMNTTEDTAQYVIVTLDVDEDSRPAVSVTPVCDGRLSVEENLEPRLIGPEKKSSVVKRRAYPPSRSKFDSSKALKGLKMFISMTDADWIAVEKRFDKMTAKTDELLLRSRFGECVGINSEDFALKLFDTLTIHWDLTREAISKCELRELWDRINDQSFDSRFRMFLDMVDKDGDCRLTEEEVKEFVKLTASANNKPITEKLAEEQAAMIMEELDSDDHGYIIMEILQPLLLDVEALFEDEIKPREETKKHTKRWTRWYKRK